MDIQKMLVHRKCITYTIYIYIYNDTKKILERKIQSYFYFDCEIQTAKSIK